MIENYKFLKEHIVAENQNIEYKESWRDEYLKWICGFANARGGRIYIGVRDDGKIVGIPDSKKLLEDIPNKIKDTMGILADVNLLGKDGLDYIEINEELLEKLGLITDGKLKRAAVLLFYRNPQRLFTGCYVKIGRFGIGSDLQYQDVVEGSLILIADRVVDLIYLKY